MVGATFSRDIYAFRVSTTREQDQQIVDDLNSLPNVNRYSGFTRNCADFTRLLVNKYFPGSARADWLNDFGMTSPKAVARSLARYAKRHPELHYSVEKYTQLAGPIRRSLDNRNGTEVGFRAKKWSFPLLVLRSHMLMYFAASYYLTAWFNPEREYKAHHNAASMLPVADWAWYKERFPLVVTEAIRAGLFSHKKEIERYFRVLETEATTQLTPEGIPVISLGPARVILTHGSLTQGDAASRLLAERLLLAKISATLKARQKNRPTLSVMERDWQALERLRRLRTAEPVLTVSGQ
jgi:hypothetical protein